MSKYLCTTVHVVPDYSWVEYFAFKVYISFSIYYDVLAICLSSRERFLVECLFILEILKTDYQSLYRDLIQVKPSAV